MTDHASHLAPEDRHNLAPCADPAHQKAIAEAAELRRLVDALILNACPRDLANAMRHLSEGREQAEHCANCGAPYPTERCECVMDRRIIEQRAHPSFHETDEPEPPVVDCRVCEQPVEDPDADDICSNCYERQARRFGRIGTSVA